MMKSLFMWYMFIIFILMIMFILMTNTLHPIPLIIMLIMYSCFICIIMSMWSFNYMYSIMLFLIMISGLLILFLYFSSLISNEQIKFSLPPFIMISAASSSLLILFYLNKTSMISPPSNSLETLPLLSINVNMFSNIFKIYSYPFNNITIMCMFFLLISLFMIIKICSIKSSPLRKIS